MSFYILANAGPALTLRIKILHGFSVGGVVRFVLHRKFKDMRKGVVVLSEVSEAYLTGDHDAAAS